MLTIRPEQMEAFRAQMRKRFEDRMVLRIAKAQPDFYNHMLDPKSGDAPVRALVQHGVAKAAGYQIETEADVARFIDLMVMIAPDFDNLTEMKWARAILDEQTLSGRGKIELIHRQLPARAPEAGLPMAPGRA